MTIGLAEQSLDPQQVYWYLSATKNLSGLAAVWQEVPAYQKLLTTPLMLDVAADTNSMSQPNEGIRRSARYAGYGALRGAAGGALLGLVGGMFAGMLALPFSPWLVLSMCLVVAFINSLINGLGAVMSHVALRLTLRKHGFAPWNYVALLEYACDLAILKRIYGGYAFWHIDLRDYLADDHPHLHPLPAAGASRP